MSEVLSEKRFNEGTLLVGMTSFGFTLLLFPLFQSMAIAFAEQVIVHRPLNVVMWHKRLALLGAVSLPIFAVCLDRLCRRSALRISLRTVKEAAFVWLSIPVAIFFTGWLKLWLGIPFVILVGLALFSIHKDVKNEVDSPTIKICDLIIPFAMILLWVWFAGVGGYTYQTSDHHARNAILHDLISYKWPVYYNIDGGKGYVYYLFIWLIPSLFGKIFGWGCANFVLYIWVSIGVSLALLLTIFYVKADSKKQLLCVAAILIAWGGLDLLAQPIRDTFGLGGAEPNGIQYRPNTRILMWVFNAGVPTWVCCSLFMHIRKRLGLFVLVCCLQFTFAPVPFMGLFPIMIAAGILNLVVGVRTEGIQKTTRKLFNISNIAGAIIGVIFIIYYSSATDAQNAVLQIGLPLKDYNMGNIIRLLVFDLSGFGVFMIIIFDKYKRSRLYKLIGIILLIIPFFVREFTMSGSMVVLFMLMILFIEYMFTADKKTLRYQAALTILILCVFQAYSTALAPYVRIMRNSAVFPVVADNMKTVIAQDSVWDLSSTLADLEKPFFKVLAKPYQMDVSTLPLNVRNYQLLLKDDQDDVVHLFKGDGFYYTAQKGAVTIPLKGISLEKQFSIEAIIKPAKTQVRWAALFTSQATGNNHAFSLEHGDEKSDLWYLAYHDGGGRWIQAGSDFTFADDRWNYLVVNFDLENSRMITIYVNGELVSESQTPETCTALQAETLHIGWFGTSRNRRFNGIIQEISVKNNMLPVQQIGNNWDKIRKEVVPFNAETNIVSYLDSINDPRFTIFIAVKDECAVNMNNTIMSGLQALGLKEDLRGKIQQSYIAIIEGGQVIHETLAPDKTTALENAGVLKDGTTNYSLHSASLPSGNKASIIIDDSEYAVNWRGLNIVVYDNDAGRVVDSVAFDTWSRGLEAHRK
ncbi:MAG: hypothetical protein LBK25_09145 [Treponema sp.]|jgi:hypothetical protein|nr:hypothetical protein [Treponema sp.]